MDVAFLFIIAGVMAVCGIIGYRKGFWPTVIALLVLWAALLLFYRGMGKIISLMNGLFMGIMLVFKSGLTDLSAGNLESAAAKLESIQKPFSDQKTGLALIIVVGAAIFFGWLLSLLFRNSKPSIWGLIAGLFYGFTLCAAFLPLIFGVSLSSLFPGGQGGVAGTGGGTCSGLLDRVLCWVVQPGNQQTLGIIIAICVAVFVLLAVRFTNRGSRKG
jgi:hypothetical protein